MIILIRRGFVNSSLRLRCFGRRLVTGVLGLCALACLPLRVVAAPDLEVTRAAESVVLSWVGDGWNLESSSDLSGEWMPVSVSSSGLYEVAADGATRMFFRLTEAEVTVTRVTVTNFECVGGVYTPKGEPLVYEITDACQTWTRMTKNPDDFSSDPHLHYNAATHARYDNGTFTWTEYGPEHSQEDIEAVCAAGAADETDAAGETKTVNDTDYTEFQPGVFLKITSVE